MSVLPQAQRPLTVGDGDRRARSERPSRPVVLEPVAEGVLVAADDPRALEQPTAVARLLPREMRRLAVVVVGPVAAMVPDLATQLRPWIARGWDSIRLVGSWAGAPGGGSIPAQDLADRLGIEVIAPDGPLMVVPDGSLFVADGVDTAQAGAWWQFRPERMPVTRGARFPAPGWELDLAAIADPGIPGVVVDQIPAGLWVRREGPVDPADLAYAMPADPRSISLLVSRPGDAPVSPMHLLRVVSMLPDAVRRRLVAVPYGDDPVAGVRLGAVVATAAGCPVRVRTGVAIQVDRRRRRVVAVDDTGTPTWRPFVRELLWTPDGGTPQVARWAKRVGDLVPVGPGQLALNRNWLVELVAAGLWVRPSRRAYDMRPVRDIPLDARYCTVMVGAPDSGKVRPPWRAIVRLLSRLPADARARLRLAVPDDASGRLAQAAARACGRELAGEPVHVLDAYGEITPRFVGLPPGLLRARLGFPGRVMRVRSTQRAAVRPVPDPVRAGRTSPARPDGTDSWNAGAPPYRGSTYTGPRDEERYAEPVEAATWRPREPRPARGPYRPAAEVDVNPVVQRDDPRRWTAGIPAADASSVSGATQTSLDPRPRRHRADDPAEPPEPLY